MVTLLLRSGKAWSGQLFLTQPPCSCRGRRERKKRADGAPSEPQEAEGDKGDKAPSRVVCYLRAVFVFTFTTVIQSKNRQGSDKTLFWSSHIVLIM